MTSFFARDLEVVRRARIDDTTPVPRWVQKLGPRRGIHRRRAAWGFATAAAAAAVLLIVARPELEREATRAKGGAGVGVYVKRGDDVFVWDNEAPLRAGDAIRLRVVPGDFTRVAVFHESAGRRTRLYERELGEGEPALLETAWTLDDSGDGDELVVVLSHHPVRDLERTDLKRTDLKSTDLTAKSARWMKRFLLRVAPEKP